MKAFSLLTKDYPMKAVISRTLILASLSAWGFSPMLAKAEAKYGIVDMQAIILNVEEGKQARANLEKEIKEKEKDLVKKKEELDKMNEEWQKQKDLLSEQAKANKQKEFQEKFMALRNEEMKFQGEIKGKEAQATQKIAATVSKIVNDLGKSKGLDMVFEMNSAGLVYLKDPQDLTKEAITAYEEQAKKAKTSAKK